MNMISRVSACAAVVLMVVTPRIALAESDLQAAGHAGAVPLTSGDIEALLVGNTVKARSGENEFYFHYGQDNILVGRSIGGRWSDTGYYGIADGGRICLSMTNDKGHLRCLTLMKLDGEIGKYDVDGKRTFELLEFQSGNRL